MPVICYGILHCRYYLKRIWRIVPPYYLALAGIHYFFMPLANNPNLHGDLWYALSRHNITVSSYTSKGAAGYI